MPAILLVDDHEVVRSGLRQILAEEWPGATFGEARNSEEALVQVQALRWDLILLDVSLPGRSGLEILHDIKQQHHDARVLLVSVHPERQYAVRALKSGAMGYMTKDSPRHELVKAVRKVLAGGKYISPALAEVLAGSLGIEPDKPPHERLSNRELEIMQALASGRRIKEIAAGLCLSVKTVSTYRRRVLEKMSMESNADLTRYAIERDLQT
jgi:two-component system, NarL family, invasion response regulator UvrY